MAKNTQLSNVAANTQADAFGALLNSGTIKIYDGTQPATADTAITTQTLLATLTFGATAFGSASAGVLTANAITGGTIAASGTAAWCRCFKSDGTTVVMDGTVGTSAANLIVSTTTFTSGVSVTCSSFTHTVAKATSGS